MQNHHKLNDRDLGGGLSDLNVPRLHTTQIFFLSHHNTHCGRVPMKRLQGQDLKNS